MSKNCLLFLTFPYPVPVTKNCVIFIGCNFESRSSQVGFHRQKKDTASAKEGKVSLLRWKDKAKSVLQFTAHGRPRRLRLGLGRLQILSRSPTQATCRWWFLGLKSKSYNLFTCVFVARSSALQTKKNVPFAKKLLRSTCMQHI